MKRYDAIIFNQQLTQMQIELLAASKVIKKTATITANATTIIELETLTGSQYLAGHYKISGDATEQFNSFKIVKDSSTGNYVFFTGIDLIDNSSEIDSQQMTMSIDCVISNSKVSAQCVNVSGNTGDIEISYLIY